MVSEILDVAVEVEEVAGPFLRGRPIRIGVVVVVLVGEQGTETAAMEGLELVGHPEL